MAPAVRKHPEARPKEVRPLSTTRVPPAGAAGQERQTPERPPCGCLGGWHYISHELDGELIADPYPCRRCQPELWAEIREAVRQARS